MLRIIQTNDPFDDYKVTKLYKDCKCFGKRGDFITNNRKKIQQKSPARFMYREKKLILIVFGRGVYVDENTSQPANVRGDRFWRAASALQQAAKTSKSQKDFCSLETILLVIINVPSLLAELVGGHACDFFEHLAVVALILKAAHTADFREGGDTCQQEGFALLHTQLI